jgi:hypothetical protein
MKIVRDTSTINIINDASRSVKNASRIVIDDLRVMLEIVMSLLQLS